MQPVAQRLPSSYRDPSGFMFEKDGVIYRQVNVVYKEHYDHFIQSGLYKTLIEKKWMVPHIEVDQPINVSPGYYKTLQPERIPFLSYPYEWCFEMLKEAALFTLSIAVESLKYGMVLKDATPFNIQWRGATPVLIDTLSFEKYDSTLPWIAYRQFCECFVAPLVLMNYTHQPIQKMLLSWPDGIPVQMASSMLPMRSRLNLNVNLHIHLQAALSGKKQKDNQKPASFSEKKFRHLLESLTSLVRNLEWKGKQAGWSNYYNEAAQRNDYLPRKKQVVQKWIDELDVSSAIDLGANEGEFSFITASKGIRTIAADSDHDSINKLFLQIKEKQQENIWPLIIDLPDPSPGIGWNNEERMPFMERSKSHLALALALVHHLCIGRNITLEQTAGLFANLCSILLIEFVPKDDPKVQEMLIQKKDIYTSYNLENFLLAYEKLFRIEKNEQLPGGRTLYLMKKHA
ncbi:MAG: hypothetical protein ACJ75F_09480 [Flavisolibacter sp.]